MAPACTVITRTRLPPEIASCVAPGPVRVMSWVSESCPQRTGQGDRPGRASGQGEKNRVTVAGGGDRLAQRAVAGGANAVVLVGGDVDGPVETTKSDRWL